MTEQAREAAQDIWHFYHPQKLTWVEQRIQAVIDKSRATLPSAGDWIAVTDRLPQFSREVLYWDGEEVGTFIPVTGADVINQPAARCEQFGVTHWMPMPMPPPPTALPSPPPPQPAAEGGAWTVETEGEIGHARLLDGKRRVMATNYRWHLQPICYAINSDLASSRSHIKELERELQAANATIAGARIMCARNFDEAERLQSREVDLTAALQQCIKDIEFWSVILEKEWPGFDGQLYAASNNARTVLKPASALTATTKP